MTEIAIIVDLTACGGDLRVRISKSKFVAGVECLKRLYWQVHDPQLAAQPDAAAWLERGSLGFGNSEGKKETEKIILDAGRKLMSPEFRNRLTKTIVFEPLSQESLMTILEMRLTAAEQRFVMGSGHSSLVS